MLMMLSREKGIAMGRAALLTAFIGDAVLNCWSQQSPPSKPSVPGVLTKLHSKHASERTGALEIASDQSLLHSRKIQDVLLGVIAILLAVAVYAPESLRRKIRRSWSRIPHRSWPNHRRPTRLLH